MKTTAHPRRHLRHGSPLRQAGFSLIELMVALTLGLIIVGGVISIFVNNQQAFRTTEALGRLQENARISFELMAREVRQAGGNPCGTPLVRSVLNTTDWATDWNAGTVIGYTGTDITPFQAFGTSTADRVAGTDAVKVLGSSIGFSAGIESHTLAPPLPSTDPAKITLTAAAAGLGAAGTVIICDGISAAIAHVSSVSGTKTLEFDKSIGPAGNCVTGFAMGSTCGPPAISDERVFGSDGFVAPLNASFWYIGINNRGGKSLYRKAISGTDEIAENVVGMQIAYLLRDESTGALDSDWVAADAVTNWTSVAAKKLVAIRFTVALETINKVGTNQDVIKRELIHVVNLRNRPD